MAMGLTSSTKIRKVVDTGRWSPSTRLAMQAGMPPERYR